MSSKNTSATASLTSMSSNCTPEKDVHHPSTIDVTPKVPESISATKPDTTTDTAATSNYSPHFVSNTLLIVDPAPNQNLCPNNFRIITE